MAAKASQRPGHDFSPRSKNLVFFTCPRVFALAPRERRVCERQAGRHDLSLMRWAVCPPSFVELGAREGTALMRPDSENPGQTYPRLLRTNAPSIGVEGGSPGHCRG